MDKMPANKHDTPPDEVLVAQYYGCDNGAFAALYSRYRGQLIAFFRLHGAAEDAEDLTEETFLRIVNSKAGGEKRYDPNRVPFKAYLYWLARRVLLDHRRRQGRQVPIADMAEEESEVALVELEADDRPSIEALLVQREQLENFIEALLRCLGELLKRPNRTFDHLLLLVLVDMVGLSLKTVHELFYKPHGIPYGTVGRWLTEVRRTVEECLKARGYQFVLKESSEVLRESVVLEFRLELLVYRRSEREGGQR